MRPLALTGSPALTGPLVLAGSLVLAGLLASRPSWAAMCRGVAFPDKAQVSGTPLALRGLGIRKATFLHIQVYVAALYLPSGVGQGASDEGAATRAQEVIRSHAPWQLALRFVRGVGVGDIRNAFAEGFAAAGGGKAPPALTDRIAMLDGWLEDMRDGETMTFIRSAGGVALEIGGREKGMIPGQDFAEALLAIWLGDHPPNPELKSGLLGGPCR